MPYLQTVTGRIDVRELGITSAHDHLFIDDTNVENTDELAPYLKNPEYYTHKITKMDYALLQRERYVYRDNILPETVEGVAEEVSHFYAMGGRAIIDGSNYGLGRDHEAVKRVSMMTGVRVVLGTGFYTANSYPHWLYNMSTEEIAELMTREIVEGIEESDIRAGVIGEIGMTLEFGDTEKRVLAAAGMTQQRTGAGILTHTVFDHAMEALDIIEKNGGDCHKVMLSHCDYYWQRPKYIEEFLRRGASVSFDTFGFELDFLPTDENRITGIRSLLDDGYADRVMLGQDVCQKMQMKRYGGHGYAHLLETVKPKMLSNGFSEREVNAMLVENPARVFCMEGN